MMATRQRRWYKIPGPLQELIEGLATQHSSWSPKQIYDDLKCQHRYQYPEIEKYGLPEIRTVERVVKEFRPPDPSGDWVSTEWPGEDAALVLEVMAEVHRSWPKEPFPKFTKREAKLIRWVRKAAPTLPPSSCYFIARLYLVCESKGENIEHLDRFLALRLWERLDNPKVYEEATQFPTTLEMELIRLNVERIRKDMSYYQEGNDNDGRSE
jgi:hypothetical protein